MRLETGVAWIEFDTEFERELESELEDIDEDGEGTAKSITGCEATNEDLLIEFEPIRRTSLNFILESKFCWEIRSRVNEPETLAVSERPSLLYVAVSGR